MATSHAAIKVELQDMLDVLRSTGASNIEDVYTDKMATIIQNAILSADLDGTAPNVQSGGTDRTLTGGLV